MNNLRATVSQQQDTIRRLDDEYQDLVQRLNEYQDLVQQLNDDRHELHSIINRWKTLTGTLKLISSFKFR